MLYPVNHKARSIMSLKAYPSVSAISDEIDLVVIVVPPKAVHSVLQQVGSKRVKGAVVVAA